MLIVSPVEVSERTNSFISLSAVEITLLAKKLKTVDLKNIALSVSGPLIKVPAA